MRITPGCGREYGTRRANLGQKVDVSDSNTSAAALAPPRGPFLGRAALTALALGALLSLAGTGILKCPVALLFHAPCPGCGATRSAWALLALDPVGALRWNVVALLNIAIMALLWVRGIVLIAREGNPGRIFADPIGKPLVLAFCGVWVIELLYWLLRFAGLFGGPCPIP